MRTRSLSALLGLVLAAGLATVITPPAAYAAPIDCDGENPPPICSENPVENDPQGDLASATRVPGGVRVTGWAADADGGPVTVVFTIGGTQVGSLVANQSDPTVSGNVAFNGVVPAVPGYQICATARNIGSGGDVVIGCLDVSIPFLPFGTLERVERSAEQVNVAGWTIDPDTISPIAVKIYNDGQLAATVAAELTRTDIGVAYPLYGSGHGFNTNISASASDGDHQVCVYAVPVETAGAESPVELGCQSYQVRHNPYGGLDEVTRVGRTVRIGGTATDLDAPSTPVQVQLFVDGGYVADVMADGDQNSFLTTIPASGSVGTHQVCAYALNIGVGATTQLGCASYEIPPQVAAVTLSVGRVDSDEIELNWTSTDLNVTGFRIEMTNGGGNWFVVGTEAGDVRTHVFTGLDAHHPYCLAVYSLGDFTEAVAATCVVTQYAPYPAATGISFDFVTRTSFLLYWTDNADDESQYLIEVRGANGEQAPLSFTAAGVAGTGVRNFSVTGLVQGTQYVVAIRPYHADHEQTPAIEATVRTLAEPRINSFTANPASVAACTAQAVTFEYSADDTYYVEIKADGNRVYSDNTSSTPSTHAQTMTLSITGGHTYTLVAHGVYGTVVEKSAVTESIMTDSMVSSFRYGAPTGSGTHYLYYYSEAGVQLGYIGSITGGWSANFNFSRCMIARVGAVNEAGQVVFMSADVMIGYPTGKSVVLN